MESSMRLGLLGQGALRRILQAHLETLTRVEVTGYERLEEGMPACTLLVSAADAWNPEEQRALNAYSLRTGIPWLGVFIEFGRAILGPYVLPGSPGCANCAEMRRLNAQDDAVAFAGIRERFAASERRARADVSWLTSFAGQTLANLVAGEIQSSLTAPERMQTRNALVYVDLGTLKVRRHRFLPEPRCPDCGSLPADAAELADISLRSRSKIHPYTYRAQMLREKKQQLLEQYTDIETGLTQRIVKDAQHLFANYAIHMNVPGSGRREVGYGRAFAYEQALVSAIAEALERYAGMRPMGKDTVVRASRGELGDEALDPRLLGLPSEEQYSLPGFPYMRYSDDLVCNWVWGYSFLRQRPILVPESYAYYGLHLWGKEATFVYEISNGCALGGNTEEAILHGMIEIAERDAFLLTWYARLPMPRIDPRSARDPQAGLMIERLRYLTGYNVHAFNVTLEHGIPCFWVMGVDEQQRQNTPRVVCAAGAHLHPEKALVNALQELAPIIEQTRVRYAAELPRIREMLADSSKVRQMQDHSLLYGLPEAFERLAFLYDSPRRQTFEEAFDAFYSATPHTDLLDDLNEIMARYLSGGIDIIVVDQTAPEHAMGGFRCVKVIMPGMLPMTFGHHARRTAGFERLYQLPQKLGYYPRALTDADLNPYPHPFP